MCISAVIGLPQFCLYAIFFSSRYSATLFIDPRLVESMDRWCSGKESTCQCRDSGDSGSVPGLAMSPGEGNGNLLQYSCLENSMDKGVWWAPVLGGHKESDTTEQLSTHLLDQLILPRRVKHHEWLGSTPLSQPGPTVWQELESYFTNMPTPTVPEMGRSSP